jgi:hypothetical protein
MPELLLTDLRGGINDNHPATIRDNQVAEAWNIEYWTATLAGRRNGCASAVTGLPQQNWFGVHTPTSDPDDDRLWAFDADHVFMFYDDAYADTTPSVTPADLFLGVDVSAVSLHGKFFFAVQSTTSGGTALNRLHVYDGTQIRRVGLAATSAAPTVADQGAGVFSDTRYYRTRWFDSVNNLQSEPSSTQTFVPSGSGASARISRPALINESETHWIVEESVDNANFYQIASVTVATATYDDSLTSAQVTTSDFELSPDEGEYVPPRSARILVPDEDRLIAMGDYENDDLDSRVVWSPVGAAPGIGNDERIPIDNFIDLDAGTDGGITGAERFESKIIVFKRSTIYGLSRTGAAQAAYLPSIYSRTHGAMKDSVVAGTDSQGRPVIYFTDPKVGPCVFGPQGVLELGQNIQQLWRRVNQSNSVTMRAVYHAQKRQVWWHVALDAATEPDTRIVYDAQSGGFVLHTVPGDSVTACVEWNEQPHLGVQKAAFATHAIVRADEDGATDDAGVTFRAYVLTRAYRPGSLIGRSEIKGGVFDSEALAGVSISARIVRDYGAESGDFRSVSLAPAATEDYVVTPVDDLRMGSCTAVQIEFGDESARAVSPWVVNSLGLRWELQRGNLGV